MGNEVLIANSYIRSLNKLFIKKNIDIHPFEIQVPTHILQRDTYNCGTYIIYFFQRLTKSQNLNIAIDINQYRIDLKWLLLHHSSDMKERCLFCSLVIKSKKKSIFTCRLCRRRIHHRCLLTASELKEGLVRGEKTTNDMCELCRVY